MQGITLPILLHGVLYLPVRSLHYIVSQAGKLISVHLKCIMLHDLIVHCISLLMPISVPFTGLHNTFNPYIHGLYLWAVPKSFSIARNADLKQNSIHNRTVKRTKHSQAASYK